MTCSAMVPCGHTCGLGLSPVQNCVCLCYCLFQTRKKKQQIRYEYLYSIIFLYLALEKIKYFSVRKMGINIIYIWSSFLLRKTNIKHKTHLLLPLTYQSFLGKNGFQYFYINLFIFKLCYACYVIDQKWSIHAIPVIHGLRNIGCFAALTSRLLFTFIFLIAFSNL